MTSQPGPGRPVGAPTCYRHPDRETYIRCTRCERPICPDCMVAASVGFHCPECVRAGSRAVREARTRFGGRISRDPGYVSKVIIGTTVVAFLLQQASEAFTRELWLVGLAVDPVLGADLSGVAAGEWYRLLTPALLHGSLLHIGFNMYALFLFGPPLEAVLGRGRFVALYVVSALGGSAASYAFGVPKQPSVGASGAVFGLLAAYLVVSRKLGREVGGLVVLLAINVVIGFVYPNIDWRAHAGGFLAGALVALVIVNAPRARRTLVQALGCVLVAALALGVVTARTAQLTRAAPSTVARCIVTAPVDPGQTVYGCLTGEAPPG